MYRLVCLVALCVVGVCAASQDYYSVLVWQACSYFSCLSALVFFGCPCVFRDIRQDVKAANPSWRVSNLRAKGGFGHFLLRHHDLDLFGSRELEEMHPQQKYDEHIVARQQSFIQTKLEMTKRKPNCSRA